ncbi:S-adenosyl-L-methionine-dependent methyltransferase [Coniochaeta sp. 2T2.1]|nr:S-adenosyl-L-methionine-dependent methyltransferase [Coniochaeta sp. 2T2.1]
MRRTRTSPSTVGASQNIYDTPSFFSAYSTLPRAQQGLAGASEWPDLRLLLPKDLNGMSVLDLGCGDGWFSRWAIDSGASSVLALDGSANMLSRAREVSSSELYAGIEYRQVDMVNLSLGKDSFDLIFSGLALHYPPDLRLILSKLHASLKPGGSFVFSVEHPVYTAPRQPGFQHAPDTGRVYWPLTDYFDESPRCVSWLGSRVRKQHHMVQTWIGAVLDAGFGLTGLLEWGGTREGEEGRRHPDWEEGVSPRFMILSARRTWGRGFRKVKFL